MKRRHEPASQLSVLNLEYLMDLIMRGRIRIPSYARSYVWNQNQVIALIDSIARGYPVGTLMFSEGPAPEGEVHFGPITVHAPAEDRAYWVIDGQQRLVSLAAAIAGQTPGVSIAYDTRSDSFIPSSKSNKPLVVPVPILFDSSALGRWLLTSEIDAESLDVVTDISSNIRRYQFPVYVIQHEDPMVAIDIFERLNTSGVSLRPWELFSALATGSQDSAQARVRRIEETAYVVAERTGFGLIDETTIMRAILSIRTNEINRVPAISMNELQNAYDESDEPLISAVTFLQETAEIPHISFLAYKYLLVALTRFFALYPTPDARNLRLLRRWLWRSAVTGTRSSAGSSNIALRRTLGAIGYGSVSDSVRSMLRLIDSSFKRAPSIKRFNPRTAPTRILICSWWHQHPRDPRSGKPFSQSELSVALGRSTSAGRVLPTIFRGDRDLSSLSANHLLLPIIDESLEELDVLLSVPRVGTNETEWHKVLRSHAITDETANLLQQGAVPEFLSSREKVIYSQYRDFIADMCEWEFEDTPSLTDLIIDDGDEYDDTLD
jgi:Protein of unknown function DUF262